MKASESSTTPGLSPLCLHYGGTVESKSPLLGLPTRFKSPIFPRVKRCQVKIRSKRQLPHTDTPNLWPLLRTMQQTQQFDALALDSVNQDEGGVADDKLTRVLLSS